MSDSRKSPQRKAAKRKSAKPKRGTGKRAGEALASSRRDSAEAVAPRPSLWRRLALTCGLTVIAVGAVTLFGIYYRYHQLASRYDLRWVERLPRETVVYDLNGIAFATFNRDGRVTVPLEAIAPQWIDALIAREDARFHQHGGVDTAGVARAALRNLEDGRFSQGASTLTMQLARISFGLEEKTLHRKLLEATLARRVEAEFSKDQILHAYANRVFLGTGMHGVEQASRGYFGKPASDLTLGEAAMLAGIIRAPNRFSPFRHYEAALAERDAVLRRMVDEGILTTGAAELAMRETISVLPEATLASRLNPGLGLEGESYLIDAVKRELDGLFSAEELERGGLDVYTTFDLELQRAVEASVEARLREIEARPGYRHPAFASRAWESADATPYLQAAVQVIDNATGEVRAMVGGRSHADSRFNRALQARRQIGSIFKPLVYAVAYESGCFPGTLIEDRPLRRGEIAWDSTGWSPKNADGTFLSSRPSSFGLVKSRNTMTVRVAEWAGIDAVTEMVRHAGLGEVRPEELSPQLYIGNLGASLLAVTSAYTLFPNQGVRADPHWIQRVEDRNGRVLHRHPLGHERVVSAGASWMTSRVLESVLGPGGTAEAARDRHGLTAPAGGKTGTTKAYRDAWFVGYTSRLTCGVWVGLDTPDTIVDHGYGGELALPIWTDVVLSAQGLGYPAASFAQPDEVMEVELCRHSGALSTDGCAASGAAYVETVPHGLIPRGLCRHHAAGSGEEKVTEKRDGASEERGVMAKLKALLDR